MKIALIGDSHYSNMMGRSKKLKKARNEFFKHFFNFFLNQDVDLYVSLGDLTNFGTKKEYRKIYKIIDKELRTREGKFIQVVGNHDLFTCRRKKFKKRTGQDNYGYIDRKNCRIIFLDTCRENNIFYSKGIIDAKQVKWLEEKMDIEEEKYLLILAHHPISDIDVLDDDGKVDKKKNFSSILNKRKGRSIYFNGHIHRDRLRTLGNWVNFQFSDILNFPAVRIIDISKDKLAISTLEIDDPHYIWMAKFLSTGIRTFKSQPFSVVCEEVWLRDIIIKSSGIENYLEFKNPPVFVNQTNKLKLDKRQLKTLEREARRKEIFEKIDKNADLDLEESKEDTLFWKLYRE